MSEPFIGQLTLGAWSFAPKGWALSNGQLLPINQYQALFSLLGTYFGGNGTTNFGLPNLQGRTPIGISSQFPIGSVGGEPQHTLTLNEVPPHMHKVNATSATANASSPSNALLAAGGLAAYVPPSSLAAMNAQVIGPAGGSQPHENRQPFLVMNWCIALNGIFPSRS